MENLPALYNGSLVVDLLGAGVVVDVVVVELVVGVAVDGDKLPAVGVVESGLDEAVDEDEDGDGDEDTVTLNRQILVVGWGDGEAVGKRTSEGRTVTGSGLEPSSIGLELDNGAIVTLGEDDDVRALMNGELGLG